MLRISGYSKRRKITKIEIHIIKKDYRTWKFQISGFCNYFYMYLIIKVTDTCINRKI